MFSYVCLSPVASFQRNLTSLSLDYSAASQVKFSTRICPFGHTQYDIIFWSFRWQFVLHIFSIGKVKRPWKKFPPQSSQDFFAALLSSKSDQWVVEDLPWRELNIVPPWKPPLESSSKSESQFFDSLEKEFTHYRLGVDKSVVNVVYLSRVTLKEGPWIAQSPN